MSDFIITGIMFLMIINPFIFLYLKKKKFALINTISIIFYLILWFNSLGYKGLEEVNIEVVTWGLLLLSNVIFVVISCSQVMNKWFSISQMAANLLVFLSLIGSIILFYLIGDSKNFFFGLLDILFVYFLPIYLFIAIVFILYKDNKNN